MPETAAIPVADTMTETADAYAADREAQFLEIAGEIPDEGGEEAPAPGNAPAEETAAPPAADSSASTEKPEKDDTAAAPTDGAPSDDLLANAKPFTYTVDGQAKTFDGIQVLADKDGTIQGGIIPADAIKAVQDRLQRADFLEAQDKARWEKMREYESVTFKSTDGTEHKGLAAVEQYAIENARLSAAVKLMAETLENPDRVIALAVAMQANDASELQRLTRELGLAAKEASWQAREAWGATRRHVATEASQAQERTQVATQAISGAVQQWASQFPALTKTDVEMAVQHFGRVASSIVRPATPDEAKAAGVKPGELVIDHPVIHEWLKDRAALRAEQAAATAKATAAAKENEQKLAAAARGTKGNGTRRSPTATTPRQPAPKSKAEEWQDQRLRMLSGQFATDEVE